MPKDEVQPDFHNEPVDDEEDTADVVEKQQGTGVNMTDSGNYVPPVREAAAPLRTLDSFACGTYSMAGIPTNARTVYITLADC